MRDPDDSRLAARLLRLSSLRLLPLQERWQIADALERADTFDDLTPRIARLVADARLEIQ